MLEVVIFSISTSAADSSISYRFISVSGDARWTAVASWLSERAVERQQHEAAPLQAQGLWGFYTVSTVAF